MTELSAEEQAIAEEVVAETPPRMGDLTSGPIMKTLIAFSIPMLIGNLIQTINGTINAIWVGRLIGEDALAATTNANVVMFLFFALVMGFGMASTVRIGQHFGAGDIPAARRSFGNGLGFAIALSVAGSALGLIFAPAMLRAMAIPAGSMDLAVTYLRVIFFSIPFGTANMILSMGMRGAGDAKSPMFSMIISVLLDIGLNPLLIMGLGPIPALGIAGSAIASFIAGMGGMLFLLYRLYAKDLPLRLRGSEFRYLIPAGAELKFMIGKGIPMGTSMLLMSSAQMVIVGFVNREGVDATAAYGASMQLWNFLQMPAFAISSGVSAMVAQAIGASKHDRVSKVSNAGMIGNIVMTGVLSGLLLLFARLLLALFLGSESGAIPIAVHLQWVITWSFIIMGASMVIGGTLRAYGVVWLPLVIQAVALYPVRIGFYFAAYPTWGSDALWWSFPIASCFSALGTWILYLRGSWRSKQHEAYVKA
ncbi:MAG: MATE family efflux transporter [Novosphingobium sp.]